MGVDAAGNKDEGAGDQGLMFGYACRETAVLMPAPIHYAHEILRSLASARHSGAEPGLGPDSKSQVTLRYENGRPVRATSVVVSTQHAAELDQDAVRERSEEHTSELQSLMRISYAVFCLKNKKSKKDTPSYEYRTSIARTTKP